MKIKNLTQKTALEVEESDVLIIEDNQDTKQITVADMREYLAITFIDDIKRHINETLDKICGSLQSAKYQIQEKYAYTLNTWIEDMDGYVKIALRDQSTIEWLTAKQISKLLESNEESAITCNLLIDGVTVEAVSYSVESYNAEYPIDEENELSVSDAGYISFYFDIADKTKLASITYDNVQVSMNETDDAAFEFISDEEYFDNSIEVIISFSEARISNISDDGGEENYIVAASQNVHFIDGILTVDSEPDANTTFFVDTDEDMRYDEEES